MLENIINLNTNPKTNYEAYESLHKIWMIWDNNVEIIILCVHLIMNMFLTVSPDLLKLKTKPYYQIGRHLLKSINEKIKNDGEIGYNGPPFKNVWDAWKEVKKEYFIETEERDLIKCEWFLKYYLDEIDLFTLEHELLHLEICKINKSIF